MGGLAKIGAVSEEELADALPFRADETCGSHLAIRWPFLSVPYITVTYDVIVTKLFHSL